MSKILETPDRARAVPRSAAEMIELGFLAQPPVATPIVFTAAADSSAADGPYQLSSALSTSVAAAALSHEPADVPRPQVRARRALAPTKHTRRSVWMAAADSDRVAGSADSRALKRAAVCAALLTVVFLVYVALDFLS